MAGKPTTDPHDWLLARAAFESGASLRECSAAVGGRISAAWIGTRSKELGWVSPLGSGVEERKAQTAAAVEARRRKWADEKDGVVSRLIGLTEHLALRVISPHELIEVKTVSGGQGAAGTVETVRVPISEPTPRDQQALVTSVAILVDKLQLITGEATSRAESLTAGDRKAVEDRVRAIRDELAERRAGKTGAAPAEEAAAE